MSRDLLDGRDGELTTVIVWGRRGADLGLGVQPPAVHVRADIAVGPIGHRILLHWPECANAKEERLAPLAYIVNQTVECFANVRVVLAQPVPLYVACVERNCIVS